MKTDAQLRADVLAELEWDPSVPTNQVGVTVGQLSRLCREVLGKSSLQVINDRLIQEAQRELVYTALPIKQLASELGFEDDAYFSRFFRKHMGMTPKAYRAKSLAQMGIDAQTHF